MKFNNFNLRPSVLLAELVGTFILATIAITIPNPIIVGFTLVALTIAIGAISGAHVNPAITFGMWSIGKLSAIKIPFYWAMQLSGALLALLVSQLYQGEGYGISLASFNSFEGKILLAEILGTAVFAFAFAAAWQREVVDSTKALCVGLALLAGLAVGGGLLGQAAQSPSLATATETPRVTQIDGAVLNPAIALASTERADQQNPMQSLTGEIEEPAVEPRAASRLTWETILGGLAGGAIGMNLFVLTTGVNPFAKRTTKNTRFANPFAKKTTKKTTVTKVFKKGKKK